ncbi:hypothetical protein [Streptomyces chiangmaiensis]|uniref:Uncharacterized protein n=1 Tax=Streptomyces chiangmaiensis TaxID=766497 RepID=A0ABU7FJ27_9ACTN|nr:hypothetical protein [Streptomyces chiangmaiensis]MED7824132.1 hypothetical protein [Streptomyces chiangmaiensis]
MALTSSERKASTSALVSNGARHSFREDDEPVLWLSLDPTATVIVDIEVLDGRDLEGAADRT